MAKKYQFDLPTGDGYQDRWRPVPFVEALAQARGRRVVLPETYYELPGLYKSMAFSIKGVSSVEQLNRVLESLKKNLDKGGSFQTWKKQIRENGINLDLPPHRLELIMRNFNQNAYNIGRCTQAERNRHRRPYLLYDAVDDSRTRPAHAAMDGFIAHYTDPIWDTWTPQNGHRCRCSLRPLTAEQAEDRGISVVRPDAEPDTGWDYNPCAQPSEGVKRAIEGRRRSVDSRLIRALDRADYKRKPTVDTAISIGQRHAESVFNALGDRYPTQKAFKEELLSQLTYRRRTGAVPTNLATDPTEFEAQLVRAYARVLPAEWVQRASSVGKLHVREAIADEITEEFRANAVVLPVYWAGLPVTIPGFGDVIADTGDAYMNVVDLDDVIHEYMHVIQQHMPDLDDIFQQFHIRRRSGNLKKLRDIDPRFRDSELYREAGYVQPYWGKEYDPSKTYYNGRTGALELMPSVYQALFTDNRALFQQLRTLDEELFYLAIGLLFEY